MKVFGLACFLFTCAAMAQNPVNAAYKGTPDGLDIDYFPNGAIEDSCRLVNGNIHGDRYSFYKDGRLFIKEQFDQGEFHGTNFSLNPKGDTLFVEVYRHDTLIYSKDNEYHRNGRLKYTSQTWFINDSSLRKDPFIGRKTRDGVVLDGNAIEKMVNNVTIDHFYYKSGKLKYKAGYRKGQLHGKYQEYYESGGVQKEANYANGKYEGDYFEYFPSGKLRVKAFHKNNYYDGEYVEYNEKGDVVKKITYHEGMVQQ